MRKILCFLVVIILICSTMCVSGSGDGISVGDTLKLGKYMSSYIENVDGLVENLDYQKCLYNYILSNPTTGVEYLSEYRNYLYEPIDFEVIANDNGKIVAISTKIVDAGCYNEKYEVVSPQEASINQYLKTQFSNIAFTPNERASISEIRLLTEKEFDEYSFDKVALASEYTESKGSFEANTADCWWLSSDSESNKAVFVDADGNKVQQGEYVDATYMGIRPVVEFELNDIENIDDNDKITFRKKTHIDGNTVVLEPAETLSNTVVIIAKYNGNVLTNVKIVEAAVEEGVQKRLEDIYNFETESGIIKIFWWNEPEQMVPLCRQIKIDNSYLLNE